METSAAECARVIVDTIPVLMQGLGSHLRSRPGLHLSIPQFRTLMFLRRHEGASISDVAQHLEIALPSVSRLADGLVTRGLVRRQHDAGDRRRVTLALTAAGRDSLQAAQQAALDYLAQALTRLSPTTRAVVAQAMRALQGAFVPGREPESVGTR